MNSISHFIDYVKNEREPMDLGMTTAYEIARGVNNTMAPDAKRNGHLWCYSNDAIKEVESWLEGLNVGMNRNFQTFGSFEDLYDCVEEHILEKKGVGAVMVYDVALYLGERMEPQVVPQEYVYVHGRLIDTARHLCKLMNLPWQEVLCGHRISIYCFEPLGIASLDKQYAARAIEEWLCFEAKNIKKTKTLEELIEKTENR